jgi:hypothetical protein
MTEAESKLEEYQRRFRERLPLEDRVRLYEEIARQERYGNSSTATFDDSSNLRSPKR